ncbi:MAG: hypothetical protein HN509_14115, partial [Halobacteriovoraceae bacterium]|nr:hypothetical protein [Halobacteriovoraceae bacterium]
FVQMLVQLPLIFKTAYGPTGPLEVFGEASRKIFKRVGVGTVGIAATQINILVTTILATGTVVGAVSWLNYAFRLFQFPVGILGVSIAGSNLVHFSEAWKRDDKKGAVDILGTSIYFALLTIMPAFSLMWVLSEPTVQIIFQRGAFDAQDAELTAMGLRCYLLGLPSYAFYKILGPTFFSIDRPKIPVAISVGCILFNLAFCIVLVPLYGFQVLALGTSLSMLLNSGLQCLVAKRLLVLPLSFFINIRHFKILIAAGICFAVTQWLYGQFNFPVDHLFNSMVYFALCVLAGSVSYLLALLLLGERNLFSFFRRKKSQ